MDSFAPVGMSFSTMLFFAIVTATIIIACAIIISDTE